MVLLSAPDVYGYTLFCDDIRQENTGKMFLVGVYSGHMLVQAPFPVTLPKFGFAITLLQKKHLFLPNIGLRIYLPGDPDTEPSFRSDLNEANEGATIAQVNALAEASNTQLEPDDEPLVALNANIVLAPLVIKVPGAIRVRAVRGDEAVRLGSLQILRAPEPAAGSE